MIINLFFTRPLKLLLISKAVEIYIFFFSSKTLRSELNFISCDFATLDLIQL